MLVELVLCVISTTTPAVAATPAVASFNSLAPALVQDDEKPDKRPEVKELLETLKAHAGKRGDEDTEAIAAVDLLNQEFELSGLKDRAAIAKGVGDCLKQKRKEKDGQPDNQLFRAAARALGEMGPESVKQLTGWIDHKTHRKDIVLQRVLILSLGRTKDDKAIETLIDLLDNKSAAIQGASAEALGNFDGQELKVRKEIFEEVLKELTSAKNAVDIDVNDIIARERYDVIAAPMITTLQMLSGHDERDPSAWRAWWNNNKKRDWDKEG